MGQSQMSSFINSGNQSRVFTLKSGNTATFSRQLIPSGEVAAKTFVDAKVNGRDQSALTEESVKDITRTIELQQFFPAIGRLVDDRIEIMDGSRRRAACLFAGTGFEVLVTEDEIDISDARQLAADIQTAKEHNLRELGQRFLLMEAQGMNKTEIAKAEGISNAKVTRAFQAAWVPAEIIELFPVVSDLSIPDYKLLLDVAEEAKAEGVSVSDIVVQVKSRIDEDPALLNLNSDEQKTKILSFFSTAKKQLVKPAKNKSVLTEKFGSFSDRAAYAKRKTHAEKRHVQYEFHRLSAAVLEEIDMAIKSIVEKSK
ncbi:chromosome partitioning protein ParB [Pantoea rodasii]|uniref:Chromosome partitioning protein ParB n=1 Tax=Pantoea rodasii TaxID=1076549 RepID=A0A2M9W9P8_9GAMM|nr:ParB family protein [Pantoea rodasii]ORM60946.1 chromosome partitioning protein ParB [Pantoea rodasii]PJZ04260.1 chromosome partitioning protein ParB [Pantoea rodasii]